MTTRRDAVDAAIRDALAELCDAIPEDFDIEETDRAIYDRACENCAKACMDFGEDSNYAERYAAVCSALKSEGD